MSIYAKIPTHISANSTSSSSILSSHATASLLLLVSMLWTGKEPAPASLAIDNFNALGQGVLVPLGRPFATGGSLKWPAWQGLGVPWRDRPGYSAVQPTIEDGYPVQRRRSPIEFGESMEEVIAGKWSNCSPQRTTLRLDYEASLQHGESSADREIASINLIASVKSLPDDEVGAAFRTAFLPSIREVVLMPKLALTGSSIQRSRSSHPCALSSQQLAK
ncbi:hypothetical protein V1508DRAFT_442276 [Lipomyces doorenjongii]|uniref:uncharacterized protein n=1 Tax=Lipomyces doorenjongii TaxID=383834 RepID=UPI0034CE2302